MKQNMNLGKIGRHFETVRNKKKEKDKRKWPNIIRKVGWVGGRKEKV